jgi:hypothetical protein
VSKSNSCIDTRRYGQQAERCAGYSFVVLFDANGRQAFCALGGKDNDAAFFGRPSPTEQEAMVQAMRSRALAFRWRGMTRWIWV